MEREDDSSGAEEEWALVVAATSWWNWRRQASHIVPSVERVRRSSVVMAESGRRRAARHKVRSPFCYDICCPRGLLRKGKMRGSRGSEGVRARGCGGGSGGEGEHGGSGGAGSVGDGEGNGGGDDIRCGATSDGCVDDAKSGWMPCKRM